MPRKKIFNLISKPFMYLAAGIPIPYVYGLALLSAVKFSDLKVVSFIAKNQNINNLPKKINDSIAKNSLFYSNGVSKIVFLSGLAYKEKNTNLQILSTLIKTSGGISYFPSNLSIVLNNLDMQNEIDLIVGLFAKNKSVVKNKAISFTHLMNNTSSPTISSVYNTVKKEKIGGELISSYPSNNINVFSYCLQKAPDVVLIDMLSSMDELTKFDIRFLINRKTISRELLYEIMKKGLSDKDILNSMSFKHTPDSAPIKDFYDKVNAISPMKFKAFLEAKTLIQKDCLSNQLKNENKAKKENVCKVVNNNDLTANAAFKINQKVKTRKRKI